MKMEAFTPHQSLVDEEVSLVEAEDSTGTFQILEGHCDFFAHLEASVLRCRSNQGNWRNFAVEGGILVVKDGDVRVALRDGVEGSSLEEVERRVEEHYGKQREEEIRTRSALARVRIALMKSALDLEKATEL